MRRLKGLILSFSLFSAVSTAAPPTNVLLQCQNGVHASLINFRLKVEGIFDLPYESMEKDDGEKAILVFADSRVIARIMFRYSDAKFFLQNTDGSWIPCTARQISP